MQVNFNLKGVRDFERNLLNKIEEIESISQRKIEAMGLDLLEKSIPLCPVDTKALRESAKVESNGVLMAVGNGNGNIDIINSKPQRIRKGEDIEVRVSYNTDYAVKQHEEMDYYHPGGGQAKYLEQPYKQNVERYMNEYKEEIKNVGDK